MNIRSEVGRYLTDPIRRVTTVTGHLPAPWRAIVEGDRRTRVDAALDGWVPLAALLPEFLTRLSSVLHDVNCLDIGGAYSLAYQVKLGGSDYIYLGEAPNPDGPVDWPAPHLDHWNAFPKPLRGLYQEVHDGFYFLPGFSAGPLPLREIHLELVAMERTVLPLAVLMNDGGQGKLGLPADGSTKSYAFFEDGTTISEEFWPLFDAWMTVGLE